MSGESPAAVLFDVNGNALAVQNATAIPASTPAILFAGSDGTNSRYMLVDGYGRQEMVGAAAAGSAVTGNPVLMGGTDGTNAQSILTDSSGRQIVAGAGTAGSPSGGVLTIQGAVGGQAVPISGTVTATNPSVSATGSAIPASATFIGADVVSSAPTLTAGNLAGLTVTTAGRLIVDGSQVTQPVSGTVAVSSVGGTVTISGTVTSNQGTAAALAGAWPVEITDGTNVLGTSAHPVVISGAVTTNKATTSTVASVAGATSSTAVLAANANRIAASIYNGTNKNMYVLCNSGTASTSNFTILLMQGSYWEVPSDYTGAINAIWASGVSGNALVTEYTP